VVNLWHRHRAELVLALPALAVVTFGLAALGLAQLAAPARHLPLYDGVVVEDPYRYAAPSGAQAGSPATGESVAQVTGTSSPSVVVSTGENPPQAQLIAPTGAFAVSAGMTSLTGTLTPLAPTAAQAQAGAVGNIYRMTVTDQNAQPVALAIGAQATVILRAPDQNVQVAVARWDGTAFTILPTTTGNQADLLRTQADSLGDFALVPGSSTGPGPGLLLLAGAILLALAVFAGVILVRRRSAAPVPAAPRSVPAAPRPNKARKRRRQ